MFLLFFLFFYETQTATIKCKNETVTLGKKVSQWSLTGLLSANQNCVYKINAPTFSSASVTVKLKQFSEGHHLTISDQYGAVIQNQGETFEFAAELPAPTMTLRLVVGPYEDEATAPLLEELSVKNVPYSVFEPPYDQLSGDVTAEAVLTNRSNSSILFSSPSTNVLLLVSCRFFLSRFDLSFFSLEYPNPELLNAHVYSFTDDWTLIGTLYSPAAWENHNSKHLGIFITKRIESAVSVIATTDINIGRYRGWNSTFAIVDWADMSRGPYFCLDSVDGPEAITVYTMSQEYEQRGLELSDLIVTAIEGNYTSLSVLEKFPTKLGNPSVYWTFGSAVSPDELPQLLFGNIKTFVIEGGHACVNTSNNPITSGWRHPRNGRTGVIRISGSDERHFYFKAEDNSPWKYNFTFVIEGLPYGQCDLNISLAGNTTQLRMTNFPNDALNSVIFDSEYVNGTMSTGYSQALTVVFSMTGNGEKLGYLSAIFFFFCVEMSCL